MIRDTANARERARELPADELDAVSSGDQLNSGDHFRFDFFSRVRASDFDTGGGGAGKIIIQGS